MKYLSWLLVLSVLLTGCRASMPAPTPSISDVTRDTAPDVSAERVSALVQGNNAFALDLYHALRASDGNLVFSPYSISLALAMTYAGARGETAEQMAQTLHFGALDVHPAFDALDVQLTRRGAQTGAEGAQPLRLHLANAVWAEQSYRFLPDFLDTLAQYYGSGLFRADFINQYESVRREINAWVEKQTENKIKNLLAKGTLDANTRMVLVNAIYFKADWLTPFDPHATHQAPFHLLNGSEKQVDMMFADGLMLPYARGTHYQAVDLPYAGETAAMTIIVPDEGYFASCEESLDAQTLETLWQTMQPGRVALTMPKFTFESQFDLPQMLAEMGMPDAFSDLRADFSGMTGAPDLYISHVIHKAFVAVDEQGTEAAAATAVVMELKAAAPSESIHLTIDRPFIFVIRDIPSGQILFVGRVLTP